MEIEIKVTQAELDKMGVTKESLAPLIIEQLDAASLPSGRGAATWCEYWVTVTVTN